MARPEPAREALLATIRATGRRRPLVRRPVRQLPPDAIRLRYFAALRQVVADCRAAVARHVLPHLVRWAAEASSARVDAADDSVHGALEAAIADVSRNWAAANVSRVVQPVASSTANFSRAQLDGVLRSQLGVDVVRSEPWLRGELARWTSQNVALIKSIPATYFADIEKRLVDSIHSGARHEQLAEMLQERAGVSESKAQLIARDQVGKLFGQLNERRMSDLGIKRFVWRTMRDNRVRDEHEDRDGKPYAWSDWPDEELPGQPVQCRCYADPDLGDSFEEAFRALENY